MKKLLSLALTVLIVLPVMSACDVLDELRIPPAPSNSIAAPPSPLPSPPPAQTPSPAYSPTPSPTPTASPAPTRVPDGTAIAFVDKIMEKLVRSALKKPKGVVTAGDMRKMRELIHTDYNNGGVPGTVTTLEDLRWCENLSHLEINCPSATSLEPLRGLENLQILRLMGSSVSDLSPLAGKASLETVWIADSPVTDASPVLSLPRLSDFSATGTGVSDISPLAGYNALISFRCTSKLKDYTPLLQQTNLNILTVAGASNEFLRKMLNGHEHLKEVTVEECDVSKESIQMLKGLHLRCLGLVDCGLTDISWLEDSTGQMFLDLRNNGIRNWKPLLKLKGLQFLDVGGNPVTQDATLKELQRLGCTIYRK